MTYHSREVSDVIVYVSDVIISGLATSYREVNGVIVEELVTS